MSDSPTKTDEDSRAGLAFAVSAYLIWGGLPIYLKLMSHIPPAEVVAHRIIWSVPIAAAILMALGRTRDIRAALTSPKMLAMGALTATLISINWGVYVWAISNGQTVEAALGYYINPLFSIFLGATFLGEKLHRQQWVAIALAALAVTVLSVSTGRVPVVAMVLTLSWGGYALCKRSLPIGPNQGFLLEVLLLLIPSAIWVLWLQNQGIGHFGSNSRDTWLLLGGGAVTAIPLMLYANGAKRLRLTTIAILQYIAPTLIFLVATLLFREPLGLARMVAFPMIWVAVALYLHSVLWPRR